MLDESSCIQNVIPCIQLGDVNMLMEMMFWQRAGTQAETDGKKYVQFPCFVNIQT